LNSSSYFEPGVQVITYSFYKRVFTYEVVKSQGQIQSSPFALVQLFGSFEKALLTNILLRKPTKNIQ